METEVLDVTDLSCLMNSTSCPWWHFLMQFTQMALRSVVLQVWHLRRPKLCMLTVRSTTIFSSAWLPVWTEITCKNRALGSWCNLKSCTGTDLCSQPFQWHLDCSLFCYLEWRQQTLVNVKSIGERQNKCFPKQISTFHCDIHTRCKKQSPKAIVEDLISL